jgi:hypothetical protein
VRAGNPLEIRVFRLAQRSLARGGGRAGDPRLAQIVRRRRALPLSHDCTDRQSDIGLGDVLVNYVVGKARELLILREQLRLHLFGLRRGAQCSVQEFPGSFRSKHVVSPMGTVIGGQ